MFNVLQLGDIPIKIDHTAKALKRPHSKAIDDTETIEEHCAATDGIIKRRDDENTAGAHRTKDDRAARDNSTGERQCTRCSKPAQLESEYCSDQCRSRHEESQATNRRAVRSAHSRNTAAISTDGMQVHLVVPTAMYTTWAPFAELIITLAHEITAFVHSRVPVKGGGRRNEQRYQEAGFAPERKSFPEHKHIRTALLAKRNSRYDMIFASLHKLSHVMGNEYSLYTAIPNRILLDEPDKINNALRTSETIQTPLDYSRGAG